MLTYNNIQDAHADKFHGCTMVGYAQCFTVCYNSCSAVAMEGLRAPTAIPRHWGARGRAWQARQACPPERFQASLIMKIVGPLVDFHVT